MLTRAKKKQKLEEEERGFSLTGVFWDPPIFEQLGQFMGVNDVTNLGMTCKDMDHAVRVCRATEPFSIIWETTQRTKIGLENVGDEEDEQVSLKVYQIHEFAFCIADTEHHQQVYVEIAMQRVLWMERNNRLVPWLLPTGTQMRTFVDFPKTLRQGYERLFVNYPNWCSFLGPHKTTRDYRDYIKNDDVPDFNEQDKKDLRRAMAYIFSCVQRIASWQYDSAPYQSTGYLMRCLPEWLYPYFPIEFDWEACHSHRDNAVEFEYRAAPTLEAWNHFVPPLYVGIHHYFPEDLPWYDDGSADDSSGVSDNECLVDSDEIHDRDASNQEGPAQGSV